MWVLVKKVYRNRKCYHLFQVIVNIKMFTIIITYIITKTVNLILLI